MRLSTLLVSQNLFNKKIFIVIAIIIAHANNYTGFGHHEADA